jgi:hypothetical protein
MIELLERVVPVTARARDVDFELKQPVLFAAVETFAIPRDLDCMLDRRFGVVEAICF